MIRIYLAGLVALEVEGQLVDEQLLPGRQGRIVFAYLVSERHRPVSRAELAEELWPDEPPPSWERSLTVLFSKIRATLGRVGLAETLSSAFACYQLRLPTGTWVDVEAAADALERSELALRAGSMKEIGAWSRVAYHISRRPFLLGEDSIWATRKREQHNTVLVRALEHVGMFELWNGHPELAIVHVQQALNREPFRETSYEILMRAHAAAGNRAQALKIYESCRRQLSDELGVDPTAETEQVYLEILRA